MIKYQVELDLPDYKAIDVRLLLEDIDEHFDFFLIDVYKRQSYALPLMRRSVAKQALNVILRGTRTNAIFGVGTA